jgi:hypothetical protein
MRNIGIDFLVEDDQRRISDFHQFVEVVEKLIIVLNTRAHWLLDNQMTMKLIKQWLLRITDVSHLFNDFRIFSRTNSEKKLFPKKGNLKRNSFITITWTVFWWRLDFYLLYYPFIGFTENISTKRVMPISYNLNHSIPSP